MGASLPFSGFDRAFLDAAIGKIANQTDVRDDTALAKRMFGLIAHPDPEVASRRYIALAEAMPGKTYGNFLQTAEIPSLYPRTN